MYFCFATSQKQISGVCGDLEKKNWTTLVILLKYLSEHRGGRL